MAQGQLDGPTFGFVVVQRLVHFAGVLRTPEDLVDAALRGQPPHDLLPRSPADGFGQPDLFVPKVQ